MAFLAKIKAGVYILDVGRGSKYCGKSGAGPDSVLREDRPGRLVHLEVLVLQLRLAHREHLCASRVEAQSAGVVLNTERSRMKNIYLKIKMGRRKRTLSMRFLEATSYPLSARPSATCQ